MPHDDSSSPDFASRSRRRRRRRQIANKACIIGCGLFVLLLALGFIYSIRHAAWLNLPPFAIVELDHGQISILRTSSKEVWKAMGPSGLYVQPSTGPVRWLPDYRRYSPFQTGIHVPLWLLALPPTLLALLLHRRDRRLNHRLKHNLCTRCGYHLAGIAAEAPCPECGHTPTPSTSPE